MSRLLPDPNGPPQPVESGYGVIEVVLVLAALVVCAVLGIPSRTMGATRSARLQWQQRRQQTEDAVKAAERHESGR